MCSEMKIKFTHPFLPFELYSWLISSIYGLDFGTAKNMCCNSALSFDKVRKPPFQIRILALDRRLMAVWFVKIRKCQRFQICTWNAKLISTATKLSSFTTFANNASFVNSLQLAHFRTFPLSPSFARIFDDYITGFMRV